MKNKHFILIIVVVILLGFLLLWYAGRPKPERMVQARPSLHSTDDSGELRQRDATLYFSSEDGLYLVSETRQLGCNSEESCVQAVVEALISGPVQDGNAVLPSKSRILNVRIEQGTAVLDFSPEVSSGHPGGSQSELLTVYALANSVAVNFSHLRQVAILINGAKVETLKGHVDLRRPLIADFTFARQPGTGIAIEPAGNGSVKE
jgi:hypothetical protein